MASTLPTTATPLTLHHAHPSRSKPKAMSYTPIRCGPRSNRGPLQKGRTLSSESIQAIQTLKRSPFLTPTVTSNTLTRLIKSDLIATIRELLRQDQCTLALHAISTLRTEHNHSDDVTALYGDLISALGRNGLTEEIDRVVEDELLGGGGIRCGDDKGVGKVLRAVIGAERRESTVKIYLWMRARGWGGDTWEVDEYVVKLLCRGLRSLGEKELGNDVWREFGVGLNNKRRVEKLSV